MVTKCFFHSVCSSDVFSYHSCTWGQGPQIKLDHIKLWCWLYSDSKILLTFNPQRPVQLWLYSKEAKQYKNFENGIFLIEESWMQGQIWQESWHQLSVVNHFSGRDILHWGWISIPIGKLSLVLLIPWDFKASLHVTAQRFVGLFFMFKSLQLALTLVLLTVDCYSQLTWLYKPHHAQC